MELSDDQRNNASHSTHFPPPPPPSPPHPPVLPNPPSFPMKQMLPVAADVWKEEILSGIQKLQSWGKCSEDTDSVWITSNRHTSPILQHGPECGIVALCMALNILDPCALDSAPDKSQILQIAKEKGFTIQGEMFSATNLFQLARCVSNAHGEVLTGMMNNSDDIIIHLANGWPALVPYDNDGNFEPCCRKGHKAHWAVLTGFLLHCKKQNLPDLSQTNPMHQDSSMANLYYTNPSSSHQQQTRTAKTLQAILKCLHKSDVYVLARQGKSTRVHPWSFAAIADSNSNLVDVGDGIRKASDVFVIPEGGIQAGLCSQVVLIRP